MERFDTIEPRTKKQIKEYERWKKHLNITLPQEEFILKTVLTQDWNRRVILQSIKFIRKSKSSDMVDFNITLTAPSKTTDYTISNPYREDGWSDKMNTFKKRATYVYHSMLYYLS